MVQSTPLNGMISFTMAAMSAWNDRGPQNNQQLCYLSLTQHPKTSLHSDELQAHLGKPQKKKISVHLGIAQIPIGPPALKRALKSFSK